MPPKIMPEQDASGTTVTAGCKGCHQPIVAGQMRRGDDWHASCFGELERRVMCEPKRARPSGPTPRGLTKTQHFILDAAMRSPSGAIVMAAGDRRGTRIARFDEMERPVIIAYGTPEYFLSARGLLASANERFVYRITDAGRAMFPTNDRLTEVSR